MITEEALREAIAECQGAKNPNANTCIKLAAFYTILNNLYPQTNDFGYSFDSPPDPVYDSGSEFSEAIRGKSMTDVLSIVDEAMDALMVLHPNLYNATIRKLRD